MAKRITKTYDNEFKAQAVKLAQDIGAKRAAEELGVAKGTIYEWIKAFKEGRLNIKGMAHTPSNALALNEELIALRKEVKTQAKEIRRLNEMNEFLEEASAFSPPAVRSMQKTKIRIYCIKNGWRCNNR